MSGGLGEQELISNNFGTVSSKRVIFQSQKSLFSKGSQEEMPLKQVASVRFYKQKSWVAGIAGILGISLPFAIIAYVPGNIIAISGGFIILALGIWLAYLGFAGIPTVAITKAEGKVTQASGWPNEKNEAKAFALVLREKIGVQSK
jgi:hypothetical protein